MKYNYDFEDIQEIFEEKSESYSVHHPNQKLARTHLVSTYNLHTFHSDVRNSMGNSTGDRHKTQLLLLNQSISASYALYHLVQNHCYTTAYGRIRYLWELYLILQQLNRRKGRTGAKYQRNREALTDNEYMSYQTLPLTEYLSDIRETVINNLRHQHELYGEIYDYISNIGSHPHSIKTSRNDDKWNFKLERDLFEFGLVFNFGQAAQFVRTFSDVRESTDIRNEMEHVFVHIERSGLTLPEFLEDDIEFTNIW
ncbi:hypothetical protein C451_17820 [Halococcus thailandensis JCM 13552]|uniref:Uncharacterized protein n=1 Tax=Halococcus thailandensis JCM 13552 TaxID=1227457 RepID=M0MXQ1_9EURY|nr:hypothetical protein C451_17820 [Halococcus thailandensis JCM 13552]